MMNVNEKYQLTIVGDNEDSITLDCLLINVAQTKNIVKTQIQGRPGTVKEFISDGDYSVSIKGYLDGANGDLDSQITALVKYLKKKTALRVYSDKLGLFEIYDLVVERYEFPEVEGQDDNYQAFSIEAMSDRAAKIYDQ